MVLNSRFFSFRAVMLDRRLSLFAVLLMGAGILLLGYALVTLFAVPVVQLGDTVLVRYALMLDDQTLYYDTGEGDPVQYTLGEGQLLPGFETALLGMQAGEVKTFQLTPDQAYGPYRPELVLRLARSELPAETDLTIGRQILTESESGSPIAMVIVAVDDEIVTLDANHPLSGRTLTFELELVGFGEQAAGGLGQ